MTKGSRDLCDVQRPPTNEELRKYIKRTYTNGSPELQLLLAFFSADEVKTYAGTLMCVFKANGEQGPRLKWIGGGFGHPGFESALAELLQKNVQRMQAVRPATLNSVLDAERVRQLQIDALTKSRQEKARAAKRAQEDRAREEEREAVLCAEIEAFRAKRANAEFAKLQSQMTGSADFPAPPRPEVEDEGESEEEGDEEEEEDEGDDGDNQDELSMPPLASPRMVAAASLSATVTAATSKPSPLQSSSATHPLLQRSPSLPQHSPLKVSLPLLSSRLAALSSAISPPRNSLPRCSPPQPSSQQSSLPRRSPLLSVSPPHPSPQPSPLQPSPTVGYAANQARMKAVAALDTETKRQLARAQRQLALMTRGRDDAVTKADELRRLLEDSEAARRADAVEVEARIADAVEAAEIEAQNAEAARCVDFVQEADAARCEAVREVRELQGRITEVYEERREAEERADLAYTQSLEMESKLNDVLRAGGDKENATVRNGR